MDTCNIQTYFNINRKMYLNIYLSKFLTVLFSFCMKQIFIKIIILNFDLISQYVPSSKSSQLYWCSAENHMTDFPEMKTKNTRV